MVVGGGMMTAGLGIAAGIAGAALFTPFMRSRLFGVEPGDAATFAAVALLLAAIALVAAWAPARRAARISPVSALRAE
jgi:ABC-type antimicrobial peptide transport system permease subunit